MKLMIQQEVITWKLPSAVDQLESPFALPDEPRHDGLVLDRVDRARRVGHQPADLQELEAPLGNVELDEVSGVAGAWVPVLPDRRIFSYSAVTYIKIYLLSHGCLATRAVT